MKKQILATLLAANLVQAQSPEVLPSPTAPPPAEKMGLQPNNNLSKAPVNDPFFGYQWGLKNEGQSYIPKLEDTFPGKEVFSNPKTQIGWKNYDAQMKRDVNVGIADSGMFTGNHPEFKDRLAKGFNFTDKKNSNIYDDKLGHGTHMAGIIGANMNNGEGMAGLTNRVKITPLKVYSGSEKDILQKPDDVNGPTASPALSTLVIGALDYAIANKIDVLNMSLGWPRVQDSEEVHNAFKRAADAGIILVVAAGNDGHDAHIYPCAYREVICVGAVNLDGELSTFSNFGGHVDMAAPGQGILSTLPPTLPSFTFGPKGYEIKNGTSQAAAFVLGAAAILRGIYPNESAKQIRARLLLGAQPISKKITFGLLNIENSINLKSFELNAPITKGIEDATVDAKTSLFKIPVFIEKGSKVSPKIAVKSLRDDIQIVSLKKISEDASSIQYEATGKVASLKSQNHMNYVIEVNGRSTEASLILKLALSDLSPKIYSISQKEVIQKNGYLAVTDPNYSTAVRYWTFSTNSADKSMTLFVWNLINGQLQEQSIVLPLMDAPLIGFNLLADDLDFDGKVDYLFVGTRNVGVKGQKEFADFVYLDSDLKLKYRLPMELGVTIPFFNNVKEMSLAKTTLPDGRPLKIPVFWNSGVIPKMDSLRRYDPASGDQATKDEWAAAHKARHEAGKGPMYTESVLAAQGLALTEFNPRIQRIFYFQPTMVDGTVQMIPRTLTSNISEMSLRRHIYNQDARRILRKPELQNLISSQQIESALATDTVSFLIQKLEVRKLLSDSEVETLMSSGILLDMRTLAMTVQSNLDSRNGKIDLIVSLGRGVNVNLYKVTFTDLTNRFEQAQISMLPPFSFDLAKNTTKEALNLRPTGLEGETSFAAIFSPISARALLFRNDQVGGIQISLPDRSDAIANITKSFSKGRDLVSFVETVTTMQIQGTWDGRKVRSQIPIYRSAFATGLNFSQIFVPVVVSQGQLPGLVVDNSLFFSNSVLIYSLEKDGVLTSNIDRSIDIPKGCRMRRTPLLTTENYSRLAFICFENDKLELRLVDLQ